MLLVRVALAFTAVGTLIWRLCRISNLSFAIASTTSVVAIPYNAAVQKAIEVLVDESRTWAQVTIVLLGLLGALWLAKRDQPQLRMTRQFWPEIVIWFAAITMLIAGLYCHHEYLDGISTALETGGVTSKNSVSIPNVFDPKYESMMAEQLWLLILGSVTSGLALFNVAQLAGGRDVQR